VDFEICPIKREIVIDGFNSVYYFEFGKDFSHPPEKHAFWELVYVDSGEVIAITDGVGQTLSQGQMIFHKPMEIHAHVSNSVIPNNMLVVSFTTQSLAMELLSGRIFAADKTIKTLLKLFIAEAKRALGSLPDEYSNKNPLDFSSSARGSMQLMECYLTELLLNLISGENSVDTPERQDTSRELGHSSIAELIVVFLEDNVYSRLTLSDICKKFYMGKSSISKLFLEHTLYSPMEYYYRLKIKEAKKLLNEDIPVSRISDMLGYSSVHNFSRAFKKATGIPPTEYKKKINPQSK
jgi:AraC-like DNA-binding protein